MTNDIPMLQSIHKATQMGCYGIKTVLNETADRQFRAALRRKTSIRWQRRVPR